jgi:flagellar motor component MotA
MRRFGSVFVSPRQNPQEMIRHLVQYAQKARKEGIV